MTHMPASPSHQWYLARDGQQYGPLTDPELAKFVELGHLQPTDLLWREGFPDWRPALVVFPPRQAVTTSAPPAGRAQGTDRVDAGGRPEPGIDDGRAVGASAVAEGDEDRPPRRLSFARLAKLTVALAILVPSSWYAYQHRVQLMAFAKFSSPTASTVAAAPIDRKGLDVPPLKGFTTNTAQTDTNLQATPLWRTLKREFPDWYAERLKEAATLASQNKDDAAIAQQMGRALVALRRREVDNALAASLPRLKAIASTFFDNIAELRKQSTDACFAFISQGEASPTIASLLQGSQHAARLQMQLVAVFEAAADGRKLPRVYAKPRKTDYEALAAELTARGWSQSDMQLFSDERELARAAPDKVCQLVHDWFAAQLGLKDADMQLRILVDSLRPVVAG